MNKLWLAAGLVTVVAIVFAIFSQSTGKDAVVMGSNNYSRIETVTPVLNPATGAKEVAIVGSNFSFSPSVIKVKKGDKVTITFQNVDGFHDFKIDQFKVATKRVTAGQEDVATFIADTSGSFEYYCSVGSHRAMGMKGTLIVQ